MQSNDKKRSTQQSSDKTPSADAVEQTEKDPAVERGERIETGKQIARSGKKHGKVPGAE